MITGMTYHNQITLITKQSNPTLSNSIFKHKKTLRKPKLAKLN